MCGALDEEAFVVPPRSPLPLLIKRRNFAQKDIDESSFLTCALKVKLAAV